mgnify:CR=1 FL=1
MFLVSFFHQNTLKTSDLIDKSNATKASYIMNSIQANLLSIATLPLCQKKEEKIGVMMMRMRMIIMTTLDPVKFTKSLQII